MQGVFAVVVTYNGRKFIGKCLSSLQRASIPIRIVVVDNSSHDGSIEVVGRSGPEVSLFRLRANLGFGRANNIGIKFAYEQGAKHVILINQDAYVEGDTVENLARLQQEKPVFGVLSPLQLDGTGTRLDALFTKHLARGEGVGPLMNDLVLGHARDKVYGVAFVNAAIWMLSRRCIETIGLFNPVFEQYGEDQEYAERILRHGLKIGVASALRGIHDRAQTRNDRGLTVARHEMFEKATVRYRLSRSGTSTVINMMSALSRVFISSYWREAGPSADAMVRLSLLRVLLQETPSILRKRGRACNKGKAFFEEADADRRRYCLE